MHAPRIPRHAATQSAVLALGLLAALWFGTSSTTWAAGDPTWNAWQHAVQPYDPAAAAAREQAAVTRAGHGHRCSPIQHGLPTGVVVTNGAGMAWWMSFDDAWAATHDRHAAVAVRAFCYGRAA